MSVLVTVAGQSGPSIVATNGDTVAVTVSPAGATGPQGVQGATGPANTLSIGTVTSGASAAATITGTAPSQTLSLVLPVGATGAAGSVGATGSQGPAGPANTLAIGTVTSGAAAATITGTAPTQTLNLVLPAGATGATGATGAQGPAGPANTLSIGTVNSGSSPSVTITGTAPNQTLNLVLARGDTGAAGATGATGPANTLSIGSVTEGSSAGASITGTAPNQTLNLTIPATKLSIGTVASGSSPAVTITGTAPAQTINFTLVKGDTGSTGSKGDTGAAGATGAAGPANSLSIGTVSSGASAAATITGTAPSQTLNLTLPKGDKGDTGSQGPAGESYTLPTASSSVLGGVKVGSGLAIASGVLSATGGGGSANIVEATTSAGFPATGSAGTLYHATDVRRIFFWDASGVYVEAGPSGGGGSGSLTIPYGGDPFFANVSLLLQFNGSGSTMVDSSGTPKTVTANGNAAQSSTQSKWGGGGKSLYLDGTGDYVTAASMPSIGTSDFAVEMNVYLASTSAQYSGLYDQRDADNAVAPVVYLLYDAIYFYVYPGNRITGSTLSTNRWHHIAVARCDGTTRMYVNGSQVGSSFSDSTNYTGRATAFIGSLYNLFTTNGYIDDVRVTVGSARNYIGDSIAVPAAPLPTAVDLTLPVTFS